MYNSSKLAWNITCNSQWRSDAIFICQKLQNDLHAKNYDSFVSIRDQISRFEPQGHGVLDRRSFERFLGACGLFLKQQEMTTLLRALGDSDAEKANLKNFMTFLLGEFPDDRIFLLEGLWAAYNPDNGVIPRSVFMDSFNSRAHPLVKSAVMSSSDVILKLSKSLDDLCENATVITEKEFWGYFAELSACHPVQFSASFENIVLDCYCLADAPVPVSLERIARIFLVIYDKLRGKIDVRLPQVITAASKAFNLADKELKKGLDIADFVYFLTNLGLRLLPHETKALFRFLVSSGNSEYVEFPVLSRLLEEYSCAPQYPSTTSH